MTALRAVVSSASAPISAPCLWSTIAEAPASIPVKVTTPASKVAETPNNIPAIAGPSNGMIAAAVAAANAAANAAAAVAKFVATVLYHDRAAMSAVDAVHTAIREDCHAIQNWAQFCGAGLLVMSDWPGLEAPPAIK